MTREELIAECHSLFRFDATDGFLYRRYAIGGAKEGDRACRHSKRYGYYYVNVRGKTYLAHRIIWEMEIGQIPEGMWIDHIDGDKGNNCLSNLRLSTRSQNLANVPPLPNTRSGVKGVSWNTHAGKWIAKIKINQKRIHLGCFDDVESAEAAYQAKARELFGEFAFSERQRAAQSRQRGKI